MSGDTLEGWAREYIETTDLEAKFASGVPNALDPSARPQRLDAPGRPASLTVAQTSPKTPGPEALRAPARRAQVLHAFLHHELQAAELMAWAILAFSDAPPAFRKGLGRIASDEIRHMSLYRSHLGALGFAFGDFPVRDWFWRRVPSCATPSQFVATLGIGFEGANLDHAARFADRFRAVGDEAGAVLQERIAAEEIGHVRFAVEWLRRFDDAEVTFEGWRARLPAPLSPILMRGDPLNREARRKSGLDAAFVDALADWTPA